MPAGGDRKSYVWQSGWSRKKVSIPTLPSDEEEDNKSNEIVQKFGFQLVWANISQLIRMRRSILAGQQACGSSASISLLANRE